jgi:(E)-4-hydroxy-3-methylbut-2-enyl-diphosphate synthase
MGYCPDYFRYVRRQSSAVLIGNTELGGNAPILVQSMTNTSTMDTLSSVEQCKKIADAGADLVRLTAQGVREASNLANIHSELRKQGYKIPLVADIHFNPRAADEAALHVEKVRINPGNYVDPVKTFSHFEYSDDEYKAELEKIRSRFVPFLDLCKSNKTAIRIGVNHGSLSDRIMSRYGDTPSGMVESCMEFLRICVDEDFTNVVISIKASNTMIMVQTVRLLVFTMYDEGMHFPLHLGVTEAGDGEDGRIKSSVGIGALLLDGIGDTIRVSLSEDPELEIPVAGKLLDEVRRRSIHQNIDSAKALQSFDPFKYSRRQTDTVGNIGGDHLPVVITDLSVNDYNFSDETLKPDFVYVGSNLQQRNDGIPQLCNWEIYNAQENTYPVFCSEDIDCINDYKYDIAFIGLSFDNLSDLFIEKLGKLKNIVLLLETNNVNSLAEHRAIFHKLMSLDCKVPSIICSSASYNDIETAQIGLGLDFGPLLLDGFGDGIMYLDYSSPDSADVISPEIINRCLFGVLQASRQRFTKTEYISCPGCGRTLYDLQKTIAKIKERTSHLKGLKIGIMGCIVNGPGEMADADYGYVGSGRGQVSLYKGKQCIEKSIPSEEAVDKLIELIKSNGDWFDA